MEGKGSPTYLPTAVDDLWMDLLVRQAETKHSLQYARYHEMVPKMMYVQQHTTTRSIKRQPTQLVDLDEQDHIIRLTHGAMTTPSSVN